MITIFISSLLTVAFYSTYILQRTSYAAQGQVVEMQQNIRAGVDTLMLDLRQAGYDPNGTNTSGITSAQLTSISFTADLDEDGVIDNDGAIGGAATELEHYTYDLNGTTLRRSASFDDAGTNLQAVADNIENIEFAYYLDTGVEEPAPVAAAKLGDISFIRVSILARSKNQDSKYTNTTTYHTALGTDWDSSPGDGTDDGYGDGFRRRLIITQIDLRNMGL